MHNVKRSLRVEITAITLFWRFNALFLFPKKQIPYLF